MPAALSLQRAARDLGCALESPPIMYLMALAPSSRRAQAGALRSAAACFGVAPSAVDWPTITAAQMIALRSQLAERYAFATANRILAAVRGVQLACVRAGLMSREVYEMVRVKPLRGRREPTGRMLVRSEIEALFHAAAKTKGALGRRHAAMLALCYGCGLRRAEAAALRFEAYDRLAHVLTVLGKGNAERLVPLPEGTTRALEWWLELRGDRPGYLLCAVIGRSELAEVSPEIPITDSTVYAVLHVLARRAKVGHCSPHDLRRSYISQLFDTGADMVTTQGLAGHSVPTTTARYDRRGLRVRNEAVARLDVPFVTE